MEFKFDRPVWFSRNFSTDGTKIPARRMMLDQATESPVHFRSDSSAWLSLWQKPPAVLRHRDNNNSGKKIQFVPKTQEGGRSCDKVSQALSPAGNFTSKAVIADLSWLSLGEISFLYFGVW